MKPLKKIYWTVLISILLCASAVSAAEGQHPSSAGNDLLFSTFIGGIGDEQGEAVAQDPAGNVYVAGQTLSTFFPTADSASSHAVESFVGRLNWSGSTLDFINVYTADVEDWGAALAVDAAGNAYFAGRTDSSDYPTTPGAYNTEPNGNFDVFLMKIDPTGQLVYSTLLGGGENDTVNAIALDPTGAVYLTGDTASDGSSSTPFPTTPDAYEGQANGGRDVFLAKISPDGSALEYSTFLGGQGNDAAEALALFDGKVYLAGWTTSSDFDAPAGGYDTVKNGTFDAFIAALAPGSSSLEFWTYLGGEDGASITGERALDLAVDIAGNVLIAGSTVAADFPATAGAFDTTYDDSCGALLCSDGFAARLSADGQSLLWATFLGAEGDDSVEAFDLDPGGDLVMTGITASAGFPVTPDAFDGNFDGASDAFVVRLSAAGDAMLYGTFLGGMADENGKDVWVNSDGWITLTGWSDSADYPTTAAAYDPQLNAFQDVFVTVLVPPGASPIQRVYLPLVVR